MRCNEVRSLLDMSDSDARLDRAAIGRHFAGCAACERRWPEVSMLVGGTAAGGPRRRSRVGTGPRGSRRATATVLTVAAALGVAAASSVGRLWPAGNPSEAPAFAEDLAVSVRARTTMAGTVSSGSVVMDRGRRFESHVSCEVWTASPPECLGGGRSGT